MPHIEPRARVEQTRMMYRTPAIPLLNVVTAGITAAALSRVYPHPLLAAWVFLFAAVAAWRFWLWRRMRRADVAVNPDYWRHRFVAGAVTTGCLWGCLASIVFVTGDTGYYDFVSFVLGGMTAGAVIGNAAYMPAFYGFTLPTLLPMVAALFLEGTVRSAAMALLMLAFGAVLTMAGRNMNRWIFRTTRLQIEREDLINRLEETTDRLERQVEDSQQRELVLEQTTQSINRQARALHQLNGMVQRLQEAGTEAELSEIVRRFAPQVVPEAPGTLFIMNNSNNLLSAVASWGDRDGTRRDFPPDQCWGLRRGQPHLAPAQGAEVRCEHLEPGFEGGYACIPLLGRGGIVGLLHIEAEPATGANGTPDLAQNLEVFAGNLGLALANYRLRETLKVMSLRDSLTGLFNRRYLDEALALEVDRAARNGDSVGVIVGDLDHFKRLNDTHGHDGGDIALRAVAQVLARSIRKGDIACRQGGEEFVVVLPGASLELARERAAALRQPLAGLEVTHHGKLIGPITMSMGVAAYPDNGDTPDAVLRAADAAMYRAKQAGRDRVVTAEALQSRAGLAGDGV
ncbi:MAG: diguanylate cyclase [Alphaproteobacteria bacterium]|nr:diguanylate cyclase [Alphaproteobacteria bacterium]